MGKRKALSLLDNNSLGRLPRLPSDSDFSSLTWQKKVLASSKTPKTSNCGGGGSSIANQNQKPPRAATHNTLSTSRRGRQGQGQEEHLSKRFVATRKRRRGRRKPPQPQPQPQALVSHQESSQGDEKDESFSFQLPAFDIVSPKLLSESNVDNHLQEEEETDDKIPSINKTTLRNSSQTMIATDQHGKKSGPQAVSSTIKEPSMDSCSPSLCHAKESHNATNSHMNHHPSSSVQAEEDMDCGSDSDSLGMDSSTTENSPAKNVQSSRNVDTVNNVRIKPDDDIHIFTPSHVKEEKKEDSGVIRDSSGPRRGTKSPAKQDNAVHDNFPRFPQANMQDSDLLLATDDLIQQVVNFSPPDNQAVLKRMMESETTNHQCLPGVPFRIGSTVGGTKLQQSESLDNSDVTWHTSSTLDEMRREQRISQFRAGIGIGGRSIPPSSSPFQPSGSRSRAVLNSTASPKYVPPISSGKKVKSLSKKRASAAKSSDHRFESDSSVDIWYAADDDASQTTQLTVGGKRFIHLPLPPGWQVFVSEENKRPFYFHHHYGTTWDCPTILPTKTQALAMKKGGHAQKNSFMMDPSNGEIIVERNSPAIHSSTKATNTGVVSKKQHSIEEIQNRREQDEFVVKQKARGKMPTPNHGSLFTPLSSSNIQRDSSTSKTMTDELRRYHRDKGKVVDTPTIPVLSFVDEDNDDCDRLRQKGPQRLEGDAFSPEAPAETPSASGVIKEKLFLSEHTYPKVDLAASRAASEPTSVETGSSRQPELAYNKKPFEDPSKHAFNCSLSPVAEMEQASPVNLDIDDSSPVVEKKLRFEQAAVQKKVLTSTTDCLLQLGNILSGGSAKGTIHNAPAPEITLKELTEERTSFGSLQTQESETKKVVKGLSQTNGIRVQQSAKITSGDQVEDEGVDTRDSQESWDSPMPTKEDDRIPPSKHNAEKDGVSFSHGEDLMKSIPTGAQTPASEIGRARTYATPLEKTGGDPEVDEIVVVDRHANASRTLMESSSTGAQKPASETGRARKYATPLEKTGGDRDEIVVVHRHANVSRTRPYMMTSGGPKSSISRLQRKEGQKSSPMGKHTKDGIGPGSGDSRKRNQSLLKKAPGTKPPLSFSKFDPRAAFSGSRSEFGHHTLLKSGVPSIVEFVSPSSPRHAHDGSDADSYMSPLRVDFAPISQKKKRSVAQQNPNEEEFSCTDDDEGSRQVPTSQVIPSSQMSRQSTGSRPNLEGSDTDSYKSPLRDDFAPISQKKKKVSVAQKNSNEEGFSCTDDGEGRRQVPGYKTSQVIPSSQMSEQSTDNRPDFDVYEAEAYSDDNESAAPSYSNKSERSGGKDLDFHSDTASHFGTEGWTDGLQPGSTKSSDSSTVSQTSSRNLSARNTLDDHTATRSSVSRSYSGKPFWTWRVLNPRLPLCSLQNLDALVSMNQKKGKRAKGKATKGKKTTKKAGHKQTRKAPDIRRGRRRSIIR